MPFPLSMTKRHIVIAALLLHAHVSDSITWPRVSGHAHWRRRNTAARPQTLPSAWQRVGRVTLAADTAGVALITGGTGGIGLAAAHRLAARGTDLLLAYGADEERAEEACKELQVRGSAVVCGMSIQGLHACPCTLAGHVRCASARCEGRSHLREQARLLHLQCRSAWCRGGDGDANRDLERPSTVGTRPRSCGSAAVRKAATHGRYTSSVPPLI